MSQPKASNNNRLYTSIVKVPSSEQERTVGKIIRNQSLRVIPIEENQSRKQNMLTKSRIIKNKGTRQTSSKSIDISSRLAPRPKSNNLFWNADGITCNMLLNEKEESRRMGKPESKNEFLENKPNRERGTRAGQQLKKISTVKKSKISIFDNKTKNQAQNQSLSINQNTEPNRSHDPNKYKHILEQFAHQRQSILERIQCLETFKHLDQNQGCMSQSDESSSNLEGERQKEISAKKVTASTQQTAINTDTQLSSNKSIDNCTKKILTSIIGLETIEEKVGQKQIYQTQLSELKTEQLTQEKYIIRYVLERNYWQNKYEDLLNTKNMESQYKQLQQKLKDQEKKLREYQSKIQQLKDELQINKQEAIENCIAKQRRIRKLKKKIEGMRNQESLDESSETIISQINFGQESEILSTQFQLCI